jgi:DNA repair ATPase RecN
MDLDLSQDDFIPKFEKLFESMREAPLNDVHKFIEHLNIELQQSSQYEIKNIRFSISSDRSSLQSYMRRYMEETKLKDQVWNLNQIIKLTNQINNNTNKINNIEKSLKYLNSNNQLKQFMDSIYISFQK